MAKPASLPLKIAALQRVVAEPITDPAEQAALDARRKQPHAGSPAERTRSNGRLKAEPARVLELCRRLPAEGRAALLTGLVPRLSAEAQLQCLVHLLPALPRDLLRQLEEELRPHLAK